MLDKPDPSLPIYATDSKTYYRYELVRVNHLRNCYLCHAASLSPKSDLLRAGVPTPGKQIEYYENKVMGDHIRADITYLRPDFSMINTVPGAAPLWPSEQRFDYLIRKQKLVAREVRDLKVRATSSYPQRDAVLFALQNLTGKNSPDDWRKIASGMKKLPENPVAP